MVLSSALMASLKALLVSAGVVSIAVVALGATVPSISGPLGPQLPPALAWFLSWFRPPYPYVIVNVIIAAIAATSRCFHRAQPERIAITVVEEMEVMEATPAAVAEAFDDESKDFEEKRVVVVAAAAAGNGGGSGGTDGYNGDYEGERKVALGRSASARRRRVDSAEPEVPPPPPSNQKSVTYKDRTARYLSPIKLSRVRSQDDLDRRVEEFINKFKEKMRLEYEEMISQGT